MADSSPNDKTVIELREMLRSRGLPVSGSKQELIDRLQQEDGSNSSGEVEDDFADASAIEVDRDAESDGRLGALERDMALLRGEIRQVVLGMQTIALHSAQGSATTTNVAQGSAASLMTTSAAQGPAATNAAQRSATTTSAAQRSAANPQNVAQTSAAVQQQAAAQTSAANLRSSNAEQPQQMHNPRYSVVHAAENMPEFDPVCGTGQTKSAAAFITRLRALQRHYGWSDFLLLEAAQQKLRGQAKIWNEESPIVYTTFGAFEADLLATYPSYATPADVLEEIFSQKRGRSEGLEEFIRRMSVMGRRAQLPEGDMVQYIIRRIDHTQFVTSVGCVRINTITALLEAATIFKQNVPHADRLTGPGSAAPQQQQAVQQQQRIPVATTASTGTIPKMGGNRPTPTQPQRNSANQSLKCFNCRTIGHSFRECPAPQNKCANCQRIGHDASACRSEKRAERVYRIDGDNDTSMQQKDVRLNDLSVTAFIDGGSKRSLIARRLAESIGGVRQTEPICVRGFNAEPIQCSEVVTATVEVDALEYVGDIYVVDDEQLEPDVLLLGTDMLCGVGRFVLIGNNECKMVEGGATASPALDELLAEFPQCFSTSLHTLGVATTTTMNIELTTSKPICTRGCRLPFAQRPNVSKMVSELLDSGIIVHSKSPYASQLVIVKKSSGEDRLCVDYRPLNAVTVKHRYPMPIIEELLAKMAGCTHFTALDFMSGYYQVPIHPDARKYTAFDTHDGHFEFTRMPFGLVNAPSVFQAAINELIKRVPVGEAIAFMDDIVIPSCGVQQGVERLRRFLEAVTEAGLTLRMEKCVFLAERIKFCGHHVSQKGIEPGESKVAAISDFPEPANVHEVRRFLGLTGYFRKFVKDYARISQPLTELLRTVNAPQFAWGEAQQAAFDSLKLVLCTAPVLTLYDAQREHEIHTDASSQGLAGVLMQLESDQKLHPVFYYSRRCTAAESIYSSFELEVLAIVESVSRFRVYLYGKQFRVVTDCAAVTKLKSSTTLLPRIARWWLSLQEFDIEFIHRAGAQLAYADALSRAPVGEARTGPIVADRLMRIHITTDDWVVTMQQQDSKVKFIMDVLRGTVKADEEQQLRTDFTLKENRLYRNCNDRLCWVVPSGVRWRVVKGAHDDRGHFGVDKTMGHLVSDYWFPRMRTYVTKYIEACIECAYNKRPGGATEGQLHVSETVPIPFRTLHIDHLGPFVRSTKGNSYVIAVVDAFSKYAVVKAVRSTDTKAVINMMRELVQYFGTPARIVSDQGTAFTSKAFAEYCSDHSVQHIKNALRTPRANGQVERMNSLITTFLRTTHVDPRKWDADLWRFQWAINSQINSTTSCCPNDIVFRYKLRNCLDNKLLAAINNSKDNTEPSPSLDEVAKTVDAVKAKWQQRFNAKHRTPRTYSVDDLVLIENVAPSTGESRKLEPKFRGPYVVKKVLPCDRYVVADLADIQRTQRPYESVVTTDKLKPWCSLGPEAEEEDNDDQDEQDEADNPSGENV